MTQDEFSCSKAQTILGAMSIDKKLIKEEVSPRELVAIGHYVKCKDMCKKKGLSEILSREISCQEALEIWASKPGPLYLYIDVYTIREALAVEHVWGRFTGVWHFDNCVKSPCTKLRQHWQEASLSCFYDGEKETAEEIPLLILAFIESGWPIEKLLEIQEQRIKRFLKATADGDSLLLPYHRITDAVYELEQYKKALQWLLQEPASVKPIR